MGGPMKQLFLVLFFTLIHGNMLSEEITLKCNYFTHSGNEKPFRDHSDDPYINSRCDEQKLDRNVQLLRQGKTTTFDDGICKTKKTKYISFDEQTKTIKVQEGSNWKTYKTKERQRTCDTEFICRVKSQEVFIDDKKITLAIKDRYTPKNCGWPMVEPQEFLDNYKEYQNSMTKKDFDYMQTVCLGLFDMESIMQSNTDIFSIDRKTGKYKETTKRGRTTFNKRTDDLESVMYRGAFTKDTVFSKYIPEEGECSLVSIGKKF